MRLAKSSFINGVASRVRHSLYPRTFCHGAMRRNRTESVETSQPYFVVVKPDSLIEDCRGGKSQSARACLALLSRLSANSMKRHAASLFFAAAGVESVCVAAPWYWGFAF